MACDVNIVAGLDGCISDRDNGMDWLELLPDPEKSDFGWAAFMKGVDAVLIGRETRETAAASRCSHRWNVALISSIAKRKCIKSIS